MRIYRHLSALLLCSPIVAHGQPGEIQEEKGTLTQEEWEKKIKIKMEKNKGRVNYRDLPP